MILIILIPFLVYSQIDKNYRAIYDSSKKELINDINENYNENIPQGAVCRTFTGNVNVILIENDTLESLLGNGIKTVIVNDSFDDLPTYGNEVQEGKFYNYNNDIVLCRQTHTRTNDDPKTIPALFSFYQTGDSLNWIENEQVAVGDERIYQSITYRCIQAHLTLLTNNPSLTVGVLWEVVATTAEWTIGVHYNIGDEVSYNGNMYRCIQAHTAIVGWQPPNVPALWELAGDM